MMIHQAIECVLNDYVLNELHWLSKINWLAAKEHEVGTVSLAWPGGERSSNGSESGWVKRKD
jgi:hypothetical protein